MADILIKNMKMPSDENHSVVLVFGKDGFEEARDSYSALKIEGITAVALPEHHGLLGDLDEISNKLLGKGLTRFFVREKRYLTIGDARKIIENAPVIVEASDGTDN